MALALFADSAVAGNTQGGRQLMNKGKMFSFIATPTGKSVSIFGQTVFTMTKGVPVAAVPAAAAAPAPAAAAPVAEAQQSSVPEPMQSSTPEPQQSSVPAAATAAAPVVAAKTVTIGASPAVFAKAVTIAVPKTVAVVVAAPKAVTVTKGHRKLMGGKGFVFTKGFVLPQITIPTFAFAKSATGFSITKGAVVLPAVTRTVGVVVAKGVTTAPVAAAAAAAAQAAPAAPAPAPATMAVPCWSSWKTGMFMRRCASFSM